MKNSNGVKDKIIFLDRDGVINKDPKEKKYVTGLKEFKLIEGSLKAISRLSKGGYKIFIISNQQGVGKGLFSQEALEGITQYMLEKIEETGGKISGVYYCTHTEREDCLCRKPKLGLIKKALNNIDIDARKTFFIGDTENDIKTGKAAGYKTILVLSGKTTKKSDTNDWQATPDYIFSDLENAVNFILER